MSDISPEQLPNAPLWRRLFAMIYDTLLLFGVTMVFGFVYVLSKQAVLNVENFDHSETAAGDPLMLALWVVVITVFFYWFWSRIGQTLGMQSWRLKIVQKNGKPITFTQAFIRLLVAPISLSLFGLGYLWCLFGEKQTWHDIASNTRVLLLPKKKKK